MQKLAVSGCLGRMGQRIIELARQDGTFEIAALLERADHPKLPGEVNGVPIRTEPDSVKGCDVLIEFTTPEATLAHMGACLRNKVKMVIGTTGLIPDQVRRIEETARTIPIVYSANMSIGVNIVFKLAEELARYAPDAYTVRMVEAHHIHKKDAPSGTAKTLKKIIEEASAHQVPDIRSIREGEIVGDHKIVFESSEDTIILDHHAKSRDIFVKGALMASKFLAGRSTGLFAMRDVLGIK